MKPLSEHVVVPVEDTAGRRAQLVYGPPEHECILPYAYSAPRFALFVLLVICTCGVFGVFSVWFPQLFTRVARAPLPMSRASEADCLLALVHEDGWIQSQWVEVKVHRPADATKTQPQKPTDGYQEVLTPTTSLEKQPWIWFEFKKHRYVFNYEKGEFERYLSTIHEELEKITSRLDTGLDAMTQKAKMDLFGPNLVDIAAPRIPKLLFHKLVHPYYLFQVFSAVVWFNQGYDIYAVVILIMSAISMAYEIYAAIANSNRLRELVKSDTKIQVLRASASGSQQVVTLHETDLVPGDIVQLTTGPVVADVLLLTGGCVVDEASLTGEAVPINKEAVRGSGKDMITEQDARVQYKSSFLHAGSTITRLRDANGPCKAVVLSTGFSTGKGELFRSILFPRTITFEFERDAYRYLVVLATIAVAAFIKRLVDFSKQGYGLGYTLVNSLDLITITVPPALPLVLSSGIGFALARLKKGGIFCIDSQRINSCGQLDTFCFDKTGTLTEESLRLVGVDVVSDETKHFARVDTATEGFEKSLSDDFRLAMATCHSISEVDGELQGYSLELSMFHAAAVPLDFIHERTAQTTYLAVASVSDGKSYGVIKRFPFDAACQRSSVVVEHAETKQRFVFVKGSPEAVAAIAHDTPQDFAQTSLRHAADGHYCIGFGVRALAAGESLNVDERAAVEQDVHFMGIALFHNELKPESAGMLRELYDAEIDVRMITGDNALTAVHVAKLLGMPLQPRVAIVDVNEQDAVVFQSVEALRSPDDTQQQWSPVTNDSLATVLNDYDVAVTGAALEQLQRTLSDESLKQFLLQTQIFARIRPTQKAWIIERLMDYGKIVGMCGDGTNDCGALKAAHVGLALSSAEASIVAPFTSKAKAVADVPVLIREGRCALTTSFLGFKFMVLYPVIQLGMASTMGHIGSMLSNNQYLWDDLAIVLGLAITMLHTASSSKLTKQRPPQTLFSLSIVASIVGQIALYVTFFVSMFVIMAHQSWFCRRSVGMELVTAFVENPSYVNTTAFTPEVISKCSFYTEFVGEIESQVDDIAESHEDSTIWLFAHMMYFSVALAFNLKDRFRQPFFTNYYFTVLFVVALGVNVWFLLDTSNVIGTTFQTLALTSGFRWTMFAMFCAQFVLAQLWELFATWTLPQWQSNKAVGASRGVGGEAKATHVDYMALPEEGAKTARS